MNPTLAKGLQRADRERQPSTAEPIGFESLQALSATSIRFYTPVLAAPDELGCQSRTLPCSDKEGFLTAIDATDDQKLLLDRAGLSLVVTASFDRGMGRTCALVAEWPKEGTDTAVMHSEMFRFVARLPLREDTELLTMVGQDSGGAKQVTANSPEHIDIATIADFFLPTAGGKL